MVSGHLCKCSRAQGLVFPKITWELWYIFRKCVCFTSKDKSCFQKICVMAVILPNWILSTFSHRKLQDFMEEEAELSGSDVGSEDEYDGEDLNEYEEEIIDEELPNEAELGKQIQKFHMSVQLSVGLWVCVRPWLWDRTWTNLSLRPVLAGRRCWMMTSASSACTRSGTCWMGTCTVTARAGPGGSDGKT